MKSIMKIIESNFTAKYTVFRSSQLCLHNHVNLELEHPIVHSNILSQNKMRRRKRKKALKAVIASEK